MKWHSFPALNPDTNAPFTDVERQIWMKEERGLLPDDWVKDLPEGAKIKPIMGPTPTGLKPSQIWTGSTDYCNVCKTHPCKCES
jgi:hypothetical protein